MRDYVAIKYLHSLKYILFLICVSCKIFTKIRLLSEDFIGIFSLRFFLLGLDMNQEHTENYNKIIFEIYIYTYYAFSFTGKLQKKRQRNEQYSEYLETLQKYFFVNSMSPKVSQLKVNLKNFVEVSSPIFQELTWQMPNLPGFLSISIF